LGAPREAWGARSLGRSALKKQRAIILAVDLGREPIDAELAEFEALVVAAGARVVETVVQRRARVDPATLVGSGKAHEIARRVGDLGANGVFVLNELRPRQRINLERIVDAPIVDRTTVILDIFAQHARSREGKLQVELAQLRHRQANLIGAGSALSRLGGGIGTRGPGETKLEVDRRKIGARISTLRRALESVRKARATRRSGDSREPLVALVGYTNVGKSSLLNRLAHADGRGAFVADRPFATLDPTVRRVYLSDERGVRVADTVGFINALPQELINAFRATLEELHEADLFVHVLDASNPEWERQRRSVEAILRELGLEEKPVVYALNKLDVAAEPPSFPGAFAISAKSGAGIAALKAEIERRTI
jgi:GTPase